MRVMDLARDEHVKEMVDLLRQNGAKYGTTERNRYQQRCRSIRTDPTYCREFHRSATDAFAGLATTCAKTTGVSEMFTLLCSFAWRSFSCLRLFVGRYAAIDPSDSVAEGEGLGSF